MAIGETIQITHENVYQCRDALGELEKRTDEFAKMTRRYPIECEFAGYRFVFANRGDINSLISTLKGKVERYLKCLD